MNRFLFVLILITNYYHYCAACKGCVSLDEYNFDKIIKRFKVAMIKFDVSYPYGDKHDTFTKLADELKQHNDILMGEVGIKDYGEHDNEKLGEKYGIKKDDLPSIRLFINHHKDDGKIIKFTNDNQWTLDNLRNLLRDNSDLYIGLPGCLQQFDQIAMEFSDSDKQKKLLERAEKEAKKLTDNQDKKTAEIYVKFMNKIVENGRNFIENETQRLNKILNGKINERKKTELGQRLNILKSFKLPPKDEL